MSRNFSPDTGPSHFLNISPLMHNIDPRYKPLHVRHADIHTWDSLCEKPSLQTCGAPSFSFRTEVDVQTLARNLISLSFGKKLQYRYTQISFPTAGL